MPFPRQAGGKGHHEHSQSPEIAFSSTGRRKMQSRGAQIMPQIVRTGPLLGLMVRGLKLPFPRQAGGKGHREHAQRAPKSHFPRQAKGKGNRVRVPPFSSTGRAKNRTFFLRRAEQKHTSFFFDRQSRKDAHFFFDRQGGKEVSSLNIYFSFCWSQKRQEHVLRQ